MLDGHGYKNRFGLRLQCSCHRTETLFPFSCLGPLGKGLWQIVCSFSCLFVGTMLIHPICSKTWRIDVLFWAVTWLRIWSLGSFCDPLAVIFVLAKGGFVMVPEVNLLTVP